MGEEIQTKLHDLIRQRSRKVKDPAGCEIQVLEDAQTTKLAGECRCKVHDIYIEALTHGIYPYRYIRNRGVISPQEQLRLVKSRVAVVGAGGLGGSVILLLARLGIGRLVVVDADVFDETNLNRQALCVQRVLGRPKSDEAVAVVESINPGVEVSSCQVKLSTNNAAEILTGSDVVVDALDNLPDRFILEKAAKSLGIPMVHGALAGFEGQLMTIFPDDPGLKLLYGDERIDENRSKSPEAVLGVPGITPSLVATLQAMEVVKIILKRGKLFRNAMVYVDLENGEVNQFVLDSHASNEAS